MRAVPDIIELGGRLKQLSHYFKILVSKTFFTTEATEVKGEPTEDIAFVS